MEKHTILQTLINAFFPKIVLIFLFLSLVGAQMNNCAKYQHHKKLNLKKTLNRFFLIFRMSNEMSPLKEKSVNFSLFFRTYICTYVHTVDEHLYRFCFTLDEILKHNTPTVLAPRPLIRGCRLKKSAPFSRL